MRWRLLAFSNDAPDLQYPYAGFVAIRAVYIAGAHCKLDECIVDRVCYTLCLRLLGPAKLVHATRPEMV
jgi:hypothetical protein